MACKGYLHKGVQLDKKRRVRVGDFASLQHNKASRRKLLLTHTHHLKELSQSLSLGVGHNGETQNRFAKQGATQTHTPYTSGLHCSRLPEHSEVKQTRQDSNANSRCVQRIRRSSIA